MEGKYPFCDPSAKHFDKTIVMRGDKVATNVCGIFNETRLN